MGEEKGIPYKELKKKKKEKKKTKLFERGLGFARSKV